MTLIYGRPDERVVGVGVTGTVDADFDAAWLLDGRHSFPIKRTGALALQATLADPIDADLFAITHHTVEEDVDVLVKKGASTVATVTPGAWGADGIAFNPFVRLEDPVTLGDSPTTVDLTSSGNAGAYVIGEAWIGIARELDEFAPDLEYDPGLPFPWETQLAPVDDGLSEPRRLRGELMLDPTQYGDLQAWYQSTRKGVLPSLVIPDATVNDAWLATISYTSRQKAGFFFVTLEIVELQRTRW
jgi:hypothetical protein